MVSPGMPTDAVSSDQPDRKKMPVLFIGHGSPEFTVGDNRFNRCWKSLGKKIPRPLSILCISAHWVIQEGTAVTATDTPKTIHDFYGFPRPLYKIEYPAPGSPETARAIRNLVRSTRIDPDYEWGLDHGTWSVLRHMFPEADIPVLQLSLNYNHPPELNVKIGQELGKLRDEGVLIIGSGNLVHNLMLLREGSEPYSWAVQFDQFVLESIESHNVNAMAYYSRSPLAFKAHPTSEHFLPLQYVLGAAGNDSPRFFTETIFGGSVSMRGILFGG